MRPPVPFKKISGIMACDPSGIIGKDNKLPWHFEAELQHFRDTTKGHTLIMGRKTFESMPARLFQTRLGIVFSRAAFTPPSGMENRVSAVSSLDAFSALLAPAGQTTAFVVGGAEIAHLFLKNGLVSEFILTKIRKPFAGDAVLDLSLFRGWNDVTLQKTSDYTIHKLTKPAR
jgi:dihydrofolate reductase